MPLLHDPKGRGERAELLFMYRAACEGLVVSKPYGDNLRFDVLVGRGSTWRRVQIKATSHRVGRSYQPKISRCCGAIPYTAAELDFIAVYVMPADAWYIIPISACAGKLSIGLFPDRTPSKRTAGHFERFREAWHLLCVGSTT